MNNSCSKRYKSSARYVFFTQYGVPLLNNQIKVLFFPLKEKSKMNESLYLVYHEVVLCIMSKSHMLQSFNMFSLLMLFNNRKMGTMNLAFL